MKYLLIRLLSLILSILLTIIIVRFLKTNEIFRKKGVNNKQLVKYLEILNTLKFLDEVLERKLELVNQGIILDIKFLENQVKLIGFIESNKLSIWGPEFTKEIMEIYQNPEIDQKRVLNASLYVKNEINKLNNLLRNT
jgi:hypothetical protein